MEYCRTFYKGAYYPILVLLLVFIGHTMKMELIFGGIMMLTVAFGLLIGHDVKFTMMPLMATFFIIPARNFSPADPGYGEYYLQPAVLIYIIVLAAIVAASILFFVIRNRKIANPITVKGPFLSIVIFCGVLLLNGLFSENYTVMNMAFTVFMILAMPVVYLIFAAFLHFEKSVVDYFMRCLVGIGMLISAELVVAYMTDVRFVAGDIVKESVVLGWGVWTNIGSMLVFLMPACFYFAHSHKKGWIGYLLGLIELFCILLSQSRAALLVGALSFVLCVLYLCFSGKNQKLNRILTLSILALGLLALPFVFDKVKTLLGNFLEQGLGDNGRFDLWSSAIDAFLRNPILGSGFYDVCHYEGWGMFGMPQMCHNTILQVLGTAGILGILAYGYHRFETVRLVVVKRNPVKMFLGICILGFLLFGMLDVVFFIAYPNIFYTIMLLIMQYTDSPAEELYL
ncbi:MAG: O-antigen ligase family protein [Clostridia bacterium]|nr:O-antigen ligase family protein [Clostridia bacterium]